MKATTRELIVGMYDFTSAHILTAVTATLSGPEKTFTMTLDNPAPNPSRDQLDSDTVASLHDSLGANFDQAWALNRMNSAVKKYIYPSAYHIKVAVRDGNAVWLLSGNWNNSNQPDFDPIANPQNNDQTTARSSDRDWHVIVEDANLAGQFKAYLLNDYTVAHASRKLAALRNPSPRSQSSRLQKRSLRGRLRFSRPSALTAKPLQARSMGLLGESQFGNSIAPGVPGC